MANGSAGTIRGSVDFARTRFKAELLNRPVPSILLTVKKCDVIYWDFEFRMEKYADDA